MSQLQVTGEAKIRDIQGPVVANDGVVTALDGAASQYVRGDGTLADFPTSSGGGSSVSYYLNSSVSQGTIGGVAYRELSKDPIIGAGTDIAISANGYVANYITDANDPDVTIVPGGNFNCEFYFSVNNNTGNPTTYAELYKYDGTTFTLLGTSAGVPESINQGTTIAPYYFAIPVATAALSLTDRLAIRIYVNVSGRTVTLHTENGHLCQVVTTLSKGMVSLNNLTDQSQFITTGTSGTDFNIVSSGDTHTFNIPSASNNNRGLITNLAQTIGGIKTFSSNINADSGIRLKNGVAPSANGYVGIGSNTQGLTLGVYDSGSAYYHELYFPYTNGYEYTFPATSGTIALTSNLSSYVPYTGATANVDLGVYSLSAGELNIKKFGANTSAINFEQATGTSIAGAGYTSIGPIGTDGVTFFFGGATNSLTFKNNLLTSSRTYSLPDASGTLALLEGTQTFTGAKTFTQNLSLDGNGSNAGTLLLKSNSTLPTAIGYTGINSTSNSIYLTTFVSNPKTAAFDLSGLSDNIIRTFTFPNSSGTIALTSDLSGYVPYTGATANLNLGVRALLAQNIVVGQTSTQGYINFKTGGSTAISAETCQAPYGTNGMIYSFDQTGGNYKQFVIDSSLLTNNTIRTYSMPNASGTLSLTSDLGAYVTLATTQTISGAKTFSLDILVNGLTIGRGGGAYSLNTTVGVSALLANTTGGPNTAIGGNALYTNTTGNNNTGVGQGALYYNISGSLNSGFGQGALGNQTTGNGNTGLGYNAGASITTGSYNIEIGYSAGGSGNATGSYNTIIGSQLTGLSSTLANNIILADGQGNIRYRYDGTNNNLYGNVNFSSTIGNGTYTYTLPSATGTLALTSAIPANPVGGTGTTNYLPKFTGASTIGNSSIFDNGGGVGIGTTSINYNLQIGVTSDASSTINVISSTSGFNRLLFSDTNNGQGGLIYRHSTDTLSFITNDAERMHLNASGNLGLGVTPSAWSSGYKGIEIATLADIVGAEQINTGINYYVNTSSQVIYKTNAPITIFNQYNGSFKWLYAASGTGVATLTQAMTLDASGGLGIGTTLGTSYGMKLAVLDVIGLIPTTQNTLGSAVYLKSQLGTSGGENFIKNEISVYNNAANYSTALSFLVRNSTSSLEVMRATTSGLLVGTTTDAGYKLDVNGTGRFSGNVYVNDNLIFGLRPSTNEYSIQYRDLDFRLIGSSDSGTQRLFSFGYYTSNNIAGTWNSKATINSYTGAATFSSLAGSGSRTVTADASGTLSASSDSSLKQEDTTHKIEGLAEILQLQPKAYKWLSDIEIRGKEATTEIGFFADEVNPIIPSAAPKGNDDLYGFYDRAIIAALVKAVQEQQAQIEELKALIAAK